MSRTDGEENPWPHRMTSFWAVRRIVLWGLMLGLGAICLWMWNKMGDLSERYEQRRAASVAAAEAAAAAASAAPEEAASTGTEEAKPAASAAAEAVQ